MKIFPGEMLLPLLPRLSEGLIKNADGDILLDGLVTLYQSLVC